MCLNFTPNPSCKEVYLSRTIFILFWYVCMRIIISIKFFTIGNFVEITIKPFKRSQPYGAWFHHVDLSLTELRHDGAAAAGPGECQGAGKLLGILLTHCTQSCFTCTWRCASKDVDTPMWAVVELQDYREHIMYALVHVLSAGVHCAARQLVRGNTLQNVLSIECVLYEMHIEFVLYDLDSPGTRCSLIRSLIT